MFINWWAILILILLLKIYYNTSIEKPISYSNCVVLGEVKCSGVTPKTKIDGTVKHTAQLNGLGQCKRLCESAPWNLGFRCVALDWQDNGVSGSESESDKSEKSEDKSEDKSEEKKDSKKICRLYATFKGTVSDKNFKSVICLEGTFDMLYPTIK